MEGLLDLTFRCDPCGGTYLAERSHRPPLQIVRPFAQVDGSVLVHLQNIGGGVLSGDRLRTRINVGTGAVVQLTTTGATRVYRSREGTGRAVQETEIAVERNALVEYLPDPLIPFAGSSYEQRTRIVLAEGAGLFWWETVAPGRIAQGEVFAYDDLNLVADIDAAGRPIACERVRLRPMVDPVASTARFGPYRYLSTFYICRAGEPASTWSTLENEMAELIEPASVAGESTWSVSSLVRDGLVIRALTRHSLRIQSTLGECWRFAKRRLYGAEPIMPRKIY